MEFTHLVKHIKQRFNEDCLDVFIGRIAKKINWEFQQKKRDAIYKLLKVRSKDGFYLREIQGSKMYLDLNDEGISKELTFSDIREEKSTIMMHKILKEGDVVIDIGSNIGYYALIEAKLVGNKGKVYALEPVPNTLDILKKNVKVNKYKNIEVCEYAIGDKDGEAEMYIASKCNWNSMLKNKNAKIIDKITVKAVKLDTFLKNKEYPTLIRMDVEGFEGAIIKGMVELLEKGKTLKIFIEIHPHITEKKDVIEILETLKKHRFEIEMISQRSISRDPKIEDLLSDDAFLNGDKEGFQIFFHRK